MHFRVYKAKKGF